MATLLQVYCPVYSIKIFLTTGDKVAVKKYSGNFFTHTI